MLVDRVRIPSNRCRRCDINLLIHRLAREQLKTGYGIEPGLLQFRWPRIDKGLVGMTALTQ
ncbi:MAG: hypothetical protein CMJ75_22475 [Planctomycetaceae bacterium]|nr:hypothetical protein [Planctomycetaceae bacterium]